MLAKSPREGVSTKKIWKAPVGNTDQIITGSPPSRILHIPCTCRCTLQYIITVAYVMYEKYNKRKYTKTIAAGMLPFIHAFYFCTSPELSFAALAAAVAAAEVAAAVSVSVVPKAAPAAIIIDGAQYVNPSNAL